MTRTYAAGVSSRYRSRRVTSGGNYLQNWNVQALYRIAVFLERSIFEIKNSILFDIVYTVFRNNVLSGFILNVLLMSEVWDLL